MSAKQTRQQQTPPRLTKHEQWVVDRFREAKQKDKDMFERLMMSLSRDCPLPPGWWVEGEGREQMPMNRRTAAEDRAFVKRDRAWRAKQAAKVQ